MQSIKSMYFALSMALGLGSSVFAGSITGIVTRVIDGDTCIVQVHDAKAEGGNLKAELRVRLADIDAPEMKQAYGLEAKQALVLCPGNRFTKSL